MLKYVICPGIQLPDSVYIAIPKEGNDIWIGTVYHKSIMLPTTICPAHKTDEKGPKSVTYGDRKYRKAYQNPPEGKRLKPKAACRIASGVRHDHQQVGNGSKSAGCPDSEKNGRRTESFPVQLQE